MYLRDWCWWNLKEDRKRDRDTWPRSKVVRPPSCNLQQKKRKNIISLIVVLSVSPTMYGLNDQFNANTSEQTSAYQSKRAFQRRGDWGWKAASSLASPPLGFRSRESRRWRGRQLPSTGWKRADGSPTPSNATPMNKTEEGEGGVGIRGDKRNVKKRVGKEIGRRMAEKENKMQEGGRKI